MELVSDGMRVYEGIRTERLKGWTVMDEQFYSLDLPVSTKELISQAVRRAG